MKALTATTTGTPCARTLATCCSRLAIPFERASRFGPVRLEGKATPALATPPPPWSFSARNVATTTATVGANPDARHLMLKNFSAPKIAAETRLCYDEVGTFKGNRIGYDRAVAMCDVAEGPRSHGPGVFKSLNEIRHEAVFKARPSIPRNEVLRP